MFRLVRRLLPHRLLHGCAALLALALSAMGGPRLGIERAFAAGDPSDERPAIVRAAMVEAVVVAVMEPAVAIVERADLAEVPRALAPTVTRIGSPSRALLLGCALGPRAP